MAAHAAALLLYGALTVALTWPLVTQLGGLVPHDLGDPLLTTWALWWNSHTVPFSDEWWDGAVFFPAAATLTLSDHRVGLGLIATPLIWSGASPLAAHNVAFVSSFFLSAAAAYMLCFVLTRSRAAAFIGGLVFGFNPFRAEHLSHLELLASYWLPIVLLSLHRWASTRRPAWLALLSAALTLQAITCGYYFFFSGVLLALWLLWFVPRDASVRQYASLLGALIAPLVVIAPVLMTYREAHQAMDLFREPHEIETFSADLIGLITPPEPLALWDAPTAWLRSEGAVLTGVTAVLLTAAAVIMRWSSVPRGHDRRPLSTARTLVLVAAIVMATVALVPALYGPVGFDVGGLLITTSSAYKPLSVASVFFALWFLTSPRVRDAWRRQSPLAFYALATIAMWLFALGPTARFLGQRVLYRAPYSWLMLLPGFRDEFRAPARFAMLAALTLSVAAAIAFCHVLRGRSARLRLAAVTMIGAAVTAESWIAPFPVVGAPAPLEIPAAVPSGAAIAELPLGTFEDAIAMYHATWHQRPVVNGLSGYDPPHYAMLRGALNDNAVDGLSALAAHADIAIFVTRGAAGAEWVSLLESRTTARPIAATGTHDVLLLQRASRDEPPPPGTAALPVQGLTSTLYPENLWRMLDHDRVSGWSTEIGQTGGEEFTADLGTVVELEGLSLALGAHRTAYPRALAIAVSPDGRVWTEAWRGSAAAHAVAAALRDPRDIPLWFGLGGHRARYVRVRQLAQSESGWVVAELGIFGRLIAATPHKPTARD